MSQIKSKNVFEKYIGNAHMTFYNMMEDKIFIYSYLYLLSVSPLQWFFVSQIRNNRPRGACVKILLSNKNSLEDVQFNRILMKNKCYNFISC